MSEGYLTSNTTGKWCISRQIHGRWICLIQDRPLSKPEDAMIILCALHVPYTEENLDEYFPVQNGRGRCPTLALMERCNVLDPTNPCHTFKWDIGI